MFVNWLLNKPGSKSYLSQLIIKVWRVVPLFLVVYLSRNTEVSTTWHTDELHLSVALGSNRIQVMVYSE